MIALTYGGGGILIAVAGYGLVGRLSSRRRRKRSFGAWSSSWRSRGCGALAYLTVSELSPDGASPEWPLRCFTPVGTAVGGRSALAPSTLSVRSSRRGKAFDRGLSSATPIGAALVVGVLRSSTIFFGVPAEQKSLEALSGVEADEANREAAPSRFNSQTRTTEDGTARPAPARTTLDFTPACAGCLDSRVCRQRGGARAGSTGATPDRARTPSPAPQHGVRRSIICNSDPSWAFFPTCGRIRPLNRSSAAHAHRGRGAKLVRDARDARARGARRGTQCARRAEPTRSASR